MAALFSVAAWGQVLPTQDGRALDANPGWGANNYNSIRQSNRAFDSNLFITGQAGGGFYSFHGAAPYSAPNQLALNVPSADLDAFIRQSVGVQYALNPIYGPRAYLAPAQTVLGPVGILSGQNLPGSTIPRTPYPVQAGNQVRDMYQNALEAYKPIMLNLAAQPLYPTIPAAPLGPLSATPALPTDMFTRPLASPLFGVIRQQDQQRLARELTKEPGSAQVEEGTPGQVKPLYGPIQPEGALPAERNGPARSGEPGAPIAPLKPPEEKEPTGLAATGEDVFLDMLIRMNEIRRQISGEPPTTSQPHAPATAGPSGEPSPPVMGRPLVVERRNGELIVHQLAGASPDAFNLHMRRAEKLLSQGKYFDAAGEYRVAVILNRDNPLPWVGAGIALFGADEMLSAASNVYEAFQRFPPAMETRFDVEGMLGNETAKKRIGQLEGRIETAGTDADPSLIFLAAFLRQCTGRHDLAVAHARKLKTYGPEDKLYQAYAMYVLTGKRPAAATQPATQPVGQ